MGALTVVVLLSLAGSIHAQIEAHNPGLTYETYIVLAACVFAFMAAVIAMSQLSMMMTQVRQIAEYRHDEAALIVVLESLIVELKRRPAPNPTVVNFSLFGAKR